MSLNEKLEQARKLQEQRFACIEAVLTAAQHRDTAAAELDKATNELTTALAAATKSGWTTAELATLGVETPKPGGRTRPAAKRTPRTPRKQKQPTTTPDTVDLTTTEEVPAN